MALPATTDSTFVGLLRRRAADHPGHPAFTFLDHAGEEAGVLTFEALDGRARAIATELQRLELGGERALIIFPPGPEFTAALYGCIYAGVLAVPCPPPDPGRKYAGPRIRALVADAQPAAILSPAALQPAIGEVLAEGEPAGASPPLLATDGEPGPADAWARPSTGPADIALLQYTSGSTAVPRGVMVSHANILDNCEFIADGFDFESGSRGVMWLPPYHDMGLIGMFSPVHSGRPVVVMPPTAFLLDPMNWLRAVSRYRATTSGGPDFAFDLCVRRSTPQQRQGLDLSSWETAYNGAEPVRRATMDAFIEAFGPHGFRAEAFYPCYGLAEATLMVSGGDKLAPPKSLEADRAELERGRFAAAQDGSESVSLISCGRPRAGARVEIVDADNREPCAAEAVGEIWISGTSVAAGYWGRAVETEVTFGAMTAAGEGPFLRSGDLGFLRDGELYVTGRIAELLVVDERLLYPTDVELAAEASSPALRHNCAAAFVIETGGRARAALVAEVREDETDYGAVFAAIRGGVHDRLGIELAAISLISPRTIPRTSSGKTRRGECRELFLRGQLSSVGEWLDLG